MEWEQEQLRRGGHVTPDSMISSSKVKQTYTPAPSKISVRGQCLYINGRYRSVVPADTPIPTLAPAIARLAQQLSQLTASHATNSAALNNLSQERDELDDRETEMRDMVSRAEEKRAWFSSFREWVEGVASFLDEKVCPFTTNSRNLVDITLIVPSSREAGRGTCVSSQRTVRHDQPKADD